MRELDQIAPYELAVRVYEKWETAEDFVTELTDGGSVGAQSMREFRQFCLKAILYRYNIRMNPAYKGLFARADQ